MNTPQLEFSKSDFDKSSIKELEAFQNEVDWSTEVYEDVTDDDDMDDDDIDDILVLTNSEFKTIDEDKKLATTSVAPLTRKERRKKRRQDRKDRRIVRREERQEVRKKRKERRKERRKARRLSRQQRGGIFKIFKKKLLAAAISILEKIEEKIDDNSMINDGLEKLIVYLNNIYESKFAKDLENQKEKEVNKLLETSNIDKKINSLTDSLGNTIANLFAQVVNFLKKMPIAQMVLAVITPFLPKAIV